MSEIKNSKLRIIKAKDLNHHFVRKDDHVLVERVLRDFKSIYYIPLACFLGVNILLACCLIGSLVLLEHWYVDFTFIILNLVCLFFLRRCYYGYREVCPIRMFNCQYGRVYSKSKPSIKDKKGRLMLNVLKFPKTITVEFDSYFDKSFGKMSSEGALLEGVLSYNCGLNEGDDILVIYLSDRRCYAIKLGNK